MGTDVVVATPGVVPVDELTVVDGFNPRSGVDDGAQAELVASIRELGIITPLIIDQVGTQLRVVDGHRRLAAAREIGLEGVPVHVRVDGDDAALARALVVNLRRSDLNPVDEAAGFQQLVEQGRSREDVARLVGCSEDHVARRLRLLRLTPEIRGRLATRAVPVTAARALEEISEVSPAVATAVGDALADGRITAATLESDRGGALWKLAIDEEDRETRPFMLETWHAWRPKKKGYDNRSPLVEQLDEEGFNRGDHEALYAAAERYEQAAGKVDYYYDAVRLDGAEDAARAYGCLLEAPDSEDQDRRHRRFAWIADPAFAADRLTEAFEKEAARVEHATKKAARKAGSTKAAAGEPDDAEKAKRAEKRAADAKARQDATIRNLKLGAGAFEHLAAGELTLDAARLIAFLAIKKYIVTASQGARLCEQAHRTETTRETKQGAVTKTTYATAATAGEAVCARLLAAKTPAEVIGNACMFLAEGWLCDQQAVAQSERRGDPIPGQYAPDGLDVAIVDALLAVTKGWAPRELAKPLRDQVAAAKKYRAGTG